MSAPSANSNHRVINNSLGDWAARVGLAYRLNDESICRRGWCWARVLGRGGHTQGEKTRQYWKILCAHECDTPMVLGPQVGGNNSRIYRLGGAGVLPI